MIDYNKQIEEIEKAEKSAKAWSIAAVVFGSISVMFGVINLILKYAN